jgi:hypothetical protein
VKDYPFFPFYIAPFAKDVRGMTEAQVGAYVFKLMDAWQDMDYEAMPLWMRESADKAVAKSKTLSENALKRWEQSKANAMQLDSKGNANALQKDSKSNAIAMQKDGFAMQSRVEYSIVEDSREKPFVRDRTELEGQKATFEKFRLAYPGRKVGFATEWGNFAKKAGKDLGAIVEALNPALEVERDHREKRRLAGAFLPEWKNLKTWINNRCWEQSFGEIVEQPKRLTYQQENEKGYAELFRDIEEGRFLSEHAAVD